MEKNKTHDFGIESERTQYLQEEGLKILSEFHRICEAHNLLYILDYGTLLGAVRHEGFIPWDDDIDVSMPRKDYEKFLEVCQYSLKESFLLQTNKTDPNYFYPYAKLRISDDRLKENLVSHFDMIHGPWIDIFPFDYRFDDKTVEQNKVSEFNNKLSFFDLTKPGIAQDDSRISFSPKTLIKKSVVQVLRQAQKGKKRSLIMKALDKQFDKLENVINNRPQKNKSGTMMTYTFPIGTTWSEEILSINKKDFKERKLTKFEESEYYIPLDFDNLLTSRYGDYMKMPEDEGQISNHLWSQE